MGKSSGNSKKKHYIHQHNHNPKAHESKERKTENIKQLLIKRLQSCVLKSRERLTKYVPDDAIHHGKQLDPSHDLKGAARVAQAYYYPADYMHAVEPVNVLKQYEGRIWEHAEGKQLLHAMLEYGLALYNVSHRSKDAIATFLEMIRLDNCDHLYARRRLLRCYLDLGDGLLARELLEIMCAGRSSSEADAAINTSVPSSSSVAVSLTPASALTIISDRSSCCMYSRAFIEHISLLLDEEGSSEAARDQKLMEAYRVNPYTLWVIAHHGVAEEVFSRKVTAVLTRPKQDVDVLLRSGSVGDTMSFFEEDLPLWIETDGAVQWCLGWLQRHTTAPPPVTIDRGDPQPLSIVPSLSPSPSSSVMVAIDDKHSISIAELESMYADMLDTAFEIIADASQQPSTK